MQLPTIGIDLGTTNSRVGVVKNGYFEIIENNYGYRVTPSIVAFNEQEILVGKSAYNQIPKNIQNTVVNVKKLIGQKFSELKVLDQYSFNVVPWENKMPLVKIQLEKETQYFAIEEITSMLLADLKKNAEKNLGGPIMNAVITVPASFNNAQRQATKDAGRIAGFEGVRLLNEPTAAAIAYGYDLKPKETKTIMVYNLGSGSLDVTIVTIKDRLFQVRSTAGDVHLGGNDFDRKLIDYISTDILQSLKHDIHHNPTSFHCLQVECEDAKKKLSFETEASIVLDGLKKGLNYIKRINSARFESLCQDLFDRAMKPVCHALARAKMDKSRIDEVVMVGGATRMPQIQKLLSDIFRGKQLLKSVDTDEAVVRGAGIYAASLDGLIEKLKIEQVASYSLYYQSKNIQEFVTRNSRLPIKKLLTITAPTSSTVFAKIEILEDKNYDLSVSRTMSPIGSIKIRGTVSILFECDIDGVLRIYSINQDRNEKARIINWRYGWNEVAIIEMIDKAGQRRRKEVAQMRINAAKNNLESLIETVQETLNDRKVVG